MFRVWDFWIFSFWILRAVDIWTPGSEFPCTVGARVGYCYDPYMHHIYIYIYTCVHEHTPLAKPGFCSGGRIFCKPNTGALLSTSKSPNYCALLGTRANSDNDSKRIGACMDILALPLAVIIVTFIVQLAINVTLIATMVLIIIIRIRTVKPVRVILTATVK